MRDTIADICWAFVSIANTEQGSVSETIQTRSELRRVFTHGAIE